MDLWEFSFTNILFLDGIDSEELLLNLFEDLIDWIFVPLLDFGLFFCKGIYFFHFLFGDDNFCFSIKSCSLIFWTFCSFFSLFDDYEVSLDKHESDSEEMVSTESLSDAKNSFLYFFFVDDLPEKISFNERLRVKIEKQKVNMLVEWTK